MDILALIVLGAVAGAGAGLLAGLIGIGGGIVVVPVVYYGLLSGGVPPDEAVHVAVATSLAAILPAAIVSFLAHRRAGNTDFAFLRTWGPGIATGVVAAQVTAPHVRGTFMTATFALLCLIFAVRFALPQRFRPLAERPPGGAFRHLAAAGIGVSSGFAGIGGGILTNIVMTLSGLPMHKSIGRAAAAGVVVSVPATIAAALASKAMHPMELGSIDITMWLVHRPRPSRRGLALCAVSSRLVRRALEPCLRNGPVSDWVHHVALELDLNYRRAAPQHTKRLGGMASGVKDWRTGRMGVDKLFWAACILLGALLLRFGLTKLADAHIPGHEEWNDVLSASKNQYNGQCCGLGDAQLVEFDDWRRAIDGNYEVYLLGQWRRIEPWKITINQVNPTGKAIVWYDADPEEEAEEADAVVRVIIFCFKPLDTY